ncbi:MAG: OmpA family protein [Bacteroidota bacterium]
MTLILLCSISILPSCNTTKTVRGGAIGAAAGGVIGGVIGNKKGNTAVGAIIGSTVGGTAGALIGKYMDKQAKELEREIEGVEVERVGEGILLTFDSGLLFDFGSYSLTRATKDNLDNFSQSLLKYPDTYILIAGHTDNIGTDANNQILSEKRARSVSSYLSSKRVANSRLETKGYGETQPVETNASDAGRQANRRVEVAIYANEDLVRQAKNGSIN